MKAVMYILIILSVSVGGCSRKADVDELSQHFEQHRAQFDALADAACSYYASFPRGFDIFEVDAPVVYLEHHAQYAAQMNSLLKEINESRIILHRSGNTECSLFLRQWAVVDAEGSSHMGYSYHPSKLSEYNPAIHQKDNRNTRENIYFTKALADGWYIEYVNTP